MADIFTKQDRQGISNIWVEDNDAQIRKEQWFKNVRDICIIFLQKIDK